MSSSSAFLRGVQITEKTITDADFESQQQDSIFGISDQNSQQLSQTQQQPDEDLSPSEVNF